MLVLSFISELLYLALSTGESRERKCTIGQKRFLLSYDANVLSIKLSCSFFDCFEIEK